MPVLDTQGVVDNRVEALQRFHKETGCERAQLDVSGGVDSAVMLALLTEAIGPQNITAVYTGIHSSEESLTRACDVAQNFGVRIHDLDISTNFEDLVEQCIRSFPGVPDQEEVAARRAEDPTIDGSLRSCLRAPIGRYMNRLAGGGIRHGTGNECEDRWLRFYQKGGDGEVDTNPLGFLSKGEVYQVAIHLGIPWDIINAAPSPDLQGNGAAHNDEDELEAIYGFPWTYSRVSANGQYTKTGSIEIMSRILSSDYGGEDVIGRGSLDEALFLPRPPSETMIRWMAEMIRPFYRGMEYKDRLERAQQMLVSCQKAEATTRHKGNFNIKQLGVRVNLLDAGLLTDELPRG